MPWQILGGTKRFEARVAALFVVLAIAAGTAASVAPAAFPGSNGKIVFQTNRDGSAEIYTMNSDGTNRIDLTRTSAEDTTPRWSADGRRIAFVSNRDGNDEILTMEANGGDVRQLTFTTGIENRWPSWTADGRILFQRVTPGSSRDVFVVNADGTGLTNLTPDSVDSAWAAAAPRGPWIALSRITADGQRLYTMNTASGVTKPVTSAPPELSDVQANWSPSGNDLVFARSDGPDVDLFVVHKDGTGLRRLTNTPDRIEFQPAFSPDGAKVVFHACSDPGGPAQHCANYTRNADGSDETEVTQIPTAPYVDTFTGDRVDPFWGLGTTGTGPQVAQANGQLEVTLPVGTSFGSDGYANAFAFMTCRLPGDFDMQVDYGLLSGPLPVSVDVNLDAAEFTGDTYSGQHGMFVHNPGFGPQGISTHFPDPGVFKPPYNDFVPDTSLSGSIRLVRTTAGGVTTVTASRLSGTPWSFTSLPYAAPTSQAANLNVFTNLSPFADEVSVAYDNFRINSGTITCPSWWDDSAPDWQPAGNG